MKHASSIVLTAACLVAAARGGWAATPPVGPRIEALTLSPAGDGLVLEVRTSGSAHLFSCTAPTAARPELVVEWAEASSALAARLDLGDQRAPSAVLEPGGERGLRLRVPTSGLRLSGIEQFDAGLRLRLDPDQRGGTSADYELDVGDKISMSVYGQDDLSVTLEVRPDGTVDLPLIGSHRVAGKSIEQVDEEITEILSRDFLVDPKVTLEIKESARLWVTIMGEVRTPGRFALKRDMSLIDLLAEANGMTKDSGSRILITRRSASGGVTTIEVTRDRLFSESNRDANLLLERNDVVTVGGKDYYYIRGEVARPGPYYLESGTTVLKAIAVAGGLTQFGNKRQLELLRQKDKGMHEKIVVNVKAIEDGKAPDVPLLPDDTIIVLKKVF